jgi:hypothetical protein
MSLLLVHGAVAAIIFLLVNWAGRHAAPFGYYSPSTFAAVDEAPAFNLVYRVLGPVVLLVIAAAIATAAGRADLIAGSWRVTPLVFGIRWGINLGMRRHALVHWPRQVLIAAAATALSYVAYAKVLRNPQALLPDPSTLSNELWLAIIVFVYSVLNRADLLQAPDQEERRVSYLRGAFHRAHRRFHNVVRHEAHSAAIESLAFAVLIYESFNRPPLLQWIETHVVTLGGRRVSQGPMQVQHRGKLSDEQSVRLGTRGLLDAALEQWQSRNPDAQVPKERDAAGQLVDEYVASINSWASREFLAAVASKYNVRSDYSGAVMDIHDVIRDTWSIWRTREAERVDA